MNRTAPSHPAATCAVPRFALSERPRLTRRPRWFWLKSKRRWLGLIASIGLIAAQGALAEPFGWEVRNAGQSWLPQLAMDTTVDIRVTGLIARVSITQRYENGSQAWQEGRYLLPLPSDAAVSDLRIRVGERLIEGEIQEKQQAQSTYREAAASGQRAALVEQVRRNLFQTQLANIAPGEALQIEIAYWQPVSYRDQSFSLALPFTLTPRYGGLSDDQPEAQTPALAADTANTRGAPSLAPTVSLHASVQAGVAIAQVSSATHAIRVDLQADGFEVELADLVEASDRDFELRWQPAPSAAPQRALFSEIIDDVTYAMLLVVPPTQPVNPVPRELLLVLDQSGSMQGASMQQAQAAIDAALTALRPGDRFNLLRFNHQSEALFTESVDVAPAQVALARHWIAGLSAHGGTEMADALQRALTLPPANGYLRQVVLITDAAVGDEQRLLALIERQRGEARLFTVGIGSAPNDYFIRKAAELGRGSFEMIRDIQTVQPRMQALLSRIDRPLMQDLSVSWPGSVEAYPRDLPDLYAGEPLQLLAALPGVYDQSSAPAAIGVKGLGNGLQWNDQLTLQARSYPMPMGIGRLWARAKLEALQDEARRGGDSQSIREQSLALALAHGIVSRYTSLVAVERRPIRPSEQALAATTIANADPAGGLAMAQGATPARSLLGMALSLGLIGAALLRASRPDRDTASHAQPGLG